MAGFFSKLKSRISGDSSSDIIGEAGEEGYVELDTQGNESNAKIVVRPFVMEDFEHIKPVLDALREGRTIALVNIKPLKDKDIVELKRAINKLKKTCDAIEGDIAGFGEDWIAVVPSFAHIHRSHTEAKAEKDIHQVSEYGSAEENPEA